MRARCLFATVTLLALSSLALPAQGVKALKRQIGELQSHNEAQKATIEGLKADNVRLRACLDSLMTVRVEQEQAFASRDSVPFEYSDSALSLWYSRTIPVTAPDEDLETVRYSSDVDDSVFVARLQAINSAIPLSFNDIVKNYCIRYSERMPSAMRRIISATKYYWPIFDEVFSAYGLPLELKPLSIVESMMRPTATSRMGAKGLWQFMYGTARGYGLVIDSWTDERVDPYKSTEAAARYLRDAYNVFGDWLLAVASYNCGAGNVSKAIRRSGGSRNFWDIYWELPRETRSYVPAFIGALYATTYAREYGLTGEDDSFATMRVDTFVVRKNLHFKQLSAVVGVPEETVAALNPHYVNSVVPGAVRPSVLRLPVDYSAGFIDAGDSLYRYKADSLLNPVRLKKIADGAIGPGGKLVYKVRSGDVLGKIATRYGVSVAQIKRWNSLSSNTIRIGQRLVIYPRKF